MILHQFSIDTPSVLHRNDGPSMDYRWSMYGQITYFRGEFDGGMNDGEMNKKVAGDE